MSGDERRGARQSPKGNLATCGWRIGVCAEGKRGTYPLNTAETIQNSIKRVNGHEDNVRRVQFDAESVENGGDRHSTTNRPSN